MAAFSPFLALRYLMTRPIVALGVVGVAFSVWAMLLVDAVFTGFVGDIRDDVRRSTATLLVTDLPHETGYEALRAVLEADPDVGPDGTAPRLRHHGLLQSLRGDQRPVASSEVDFDQMEGGFALLLGIDPEREMRVTGLRSWLPRGRDVIEQKYHLSLPPPTLFDEPDAARLARLRVSDRAEWEARGRARLPRSDLADFRSEWDGILLSWRRLHAMPLRIGEPIDLMSASFPAGAGGGAGGPEVRTTKVRLAFAGYFATGHRIFDASTAILPIETLRTQLGHDLLDPGSIDLVTDVAVRPRDDLSVEALQACQRRLQQAVQDVLPPGSKPCSVLDWEQQNEVFLQAIAHEHTMMQFVLFVVLLVAAFVIYATLHMMVVQKWKDIGILAAIGGTPRSIGLVFVACGCVIGALGALAGAGLGTLSVFYLNDVNDWLYAKFEVELFPRQLFDLQSVPCRLEPTWAVQVTVGALLLAVLVALVPARKASCMNPVKALSYE
jgi:ABC-type lipoprotein release transport system permease subunit